MSLSVFFFWKARVSSVSQYVAYLRLKLIVHNFYPKFELLFFSFPETSGKCIHLHLGLVSNLSGKRLSNCIPRTG